MLTAKSENLSLFPSLHMVGEEAEFHKLYSDFHMYAILCTLLPCT